jgi:NADH:ubiquinone reductase (H+-translocating)
LPPIRESAEWVTFVVIGAGPTGVELVGQIAELAHIVLPKDFRSVDTTQARILLLEADGCRGAAEHWRWTWTTTRSQ